MRLVGGRYFTALASSSTSLAGIVSIQLSLRNLSLSTNLCSQFWRLAGPLLPSVTHISHFWCLEMVILFLSPIMFFDFHLLYFSPCYVFGPQGTYQKFEHSHFDWKSQGTFSMYLESKSGVSRTSPLSWSYTNTILWLIAPFLGPICSNSLIVIFFFNVDCCLKTTGLGVRQPWSKSLLCYSVTLNKTAKLYESQSFNQYYRIKTNE